MKYLYEQILIWIGKHFPTIPRFFGLKILIIGYTDITLDIGCGGKPNGRMVESKISWLIKNEWGAPIPAKIVMACVQSQDVWAQVYPVNQALHGGWNRDVSCGEEKFDPDLRQKCKSTIIPAYGLLKVDHFAGQHPHPSCGSDFAFQLKADDPSVIILHRDFFNQKGVKWRDWALRGLIAVAIAVTIGWGATYLWVQYGLPVWKHLFS